jgi:hypothetical protein
MTGKTVAVVVVAAVTSAAMLGAQDQSGSPTEGLIRKNRVPVSKEVLRVTLPRPEEADLPNGLHLIVLEDHRVPVVSFQIVIPGAGGYSDPADWPRSLRP